MIAALNSEEEARTAVEKIWIQEVRDAFSEGKSIRNGGGVFITDLSGADEQIAGYKICGVRCGLIEFDHGLTERYADIENSVIGEGEEEKEIWHFPLEDDKYLIALSGMDYEIIEKPEDWQGAIFI